MKKKGFSFYTAHISILYSYFHIIHLIQLNNRFNRKLQVNISLLSKYEFCSLNTDSNFIPV